MDTMDIGEVLTRGVAKIFSTKEGLSELMAKKKIKLYQGFDPSAPSLHLGNLVGLMKLRQFQKLGHEVIFWWGFYRNDRGSNRQTCNPQKLTVSRFIKQKPGELKPKVLDFEGDNPAKIMFNSSGAIK